MSQTLAEIVHPLIDKGMYQSAEAAVKDLMAKHTLTQIDHYRALIASLEEKYGMRYPQFQIYVHEHARQSNGDAPQQKKIMQEEEDAVEWKIAVEMLESWLGLRGNNVS